MKKTIIETILRDKIDAECVRRTAFNAKYGTTERILSTENARRKQFSHELNALLKSHRLRQLPADSLKKLFSI